MASNDPLADFRIAPGGPSAPAPADQLRANELGQPLFQEPSESADPLAEFRIDSGPRPQIRREDNTLGAELRAGLGAGIDSLQGSLYGVVGLVGRELGIQTLEDVGQAGAEEQFGEAAAATRQSAGFTDIDSAGGFFRWVAATLGEAAPSLGFAATGAGIGVSLGKKAIELGVKRSVAQQVEREMVKKFGFDRGAALEATRKFMNSKEGQKRLAKAFLRPRNAKAAADAVARDAKKVRGAAQKGLVVASSLPQIGQIDQELLEAGVEDGGLTAIIGGVAGGVLEAVSLGRLMDKMFPGVDQAVTKTFVKDFAIATGTQAVLEGSTEGAQELIQLAALAYHDPTFDMFSPDAKKRVIDAFAAGAVVGAVTGGAAEAIGQRGPAVKKAAAAKIAAFNFTAKEEEAAEEQLPDGFVPADNTVFQEIRARVFGTVQPAIESITNSLRNQFQKVVESLDTNLEGGVNAETATISQVIAAAHNKFIEDHKGQLADVKAFLEKQAEFIAKTAEAISDPDARAKFIEENIAATKERMAGFIDKFRQDAAARDQTIEAEVDNMDFDEDAFGFEDVVPPETDEILRSQAKREEAEVGEIEAVPTLTFGKFEKTPAVTVAGKQTVVGYDNRRQAEKGLNTLRKQFPEATDEDFEIREQDDGTFVVEAVNPELQDTHNFNQAIKAAQDSANRTKNTEKNLERKFKLPRAVIEKLGLKIKNPQVDIITLANRGKNIDPNAKTLRDGLNAMVGDMLARGFLDNEGANSLLEQFEENFGKEAELELDDFAPVGRFFTKGVAQAEMINFINRMKDRGLTVPRRMFDVRPNNDGTFGYGIDQPKLFRALSVKDPQGAEALKTALTEQRRQDFLADESKRSKEFSGNITGETGSGDLGDPRGATAGSGRVASDPIRTGRTGEGERVASRTKTGQPIEGTRVATSATRDTDPQADDQATNPRELPSERDQQPKAPETSKKQIDRLTEQERRILRAIKRPGKVKVLFGNDSHTDGTLTKAVKDLVQFVQKKLGLSNDIVVMDDAGLKGLIDSGAVSDPVFKETLENPNVNARNIRIGATSFIYLSPKLLQNDHMTVLALGHELGHHLFSVAQNGLTEAAQARLRKAFEDDAVALRTNTTRELKRSARDIFDNNAAEIDQINQGKFAEDETGSIEARKQFLQDENRAIKESGFDDERFGLFDETTAEQTSDQAFSEWMADQLAAWITQRRAPKGAVEAFFAKVGGQIRRLYDFLHNREDDRFRLNENFAAFADAVAAKARAAESPGANPLSDAEIRAWFKNEGITMYKFFGKLPKIEDMEIPVPRTELQQQALDRIKKNFPVVAKRAALMRNWVVNAYSLALAPSTSVVRAIGKRIKAANQLVSIFGRENHGEAKLSSNYHQRKNLFKGQFINEYDKTVNDLDSAQRVKVAKSLSDKDSNPNAEFTPVEAALRDLFDRMHEYALANGLPVRKVTNYFPRAFSNEKLIANKQKILDHLTDDVRMSLEKARGFYNSLISIDAADGRATIDAVETPGFRNMNSRTAIDKFFDQFLDDNLDGIVHNYVNAVVKRAEFNRVLGEPMPVTELTAREAIKAGIWDPKAKLNKLIGEAKKQKATDEELVILEKYVDANLGQLGRDDISPGLRKWMAGVMAYQNMRVLLFTVFASLPDLAGPAIRAGDMKGAWKSVKDNMHKLANNDNDLADMARAYGIISSTASEHIMTEYVDNHHMPPTLRKWNDSFFKWTGLNWYTDVTRKMALAVGVDYIQNQAQIMKDGDEKQAFKARDRLKELGITEAQVDAWAKNGRPTFNSQSHAMEGDEAKIAEALIQFVDESIMRPNAAQRPLLASHPGAMLVFHLKGYLYAVHEVVLKRIQFNIKESDNPAQLAAAVAPAVAMMLLTAVGLELRELIQYAGSNRKPPTDRMDGWEYTWELAQRSGLTGIAQLGIDLEGAEDRGLSHVAGVGGPTLSQVGQIISRPSTQTIPKAIPVIGQIPAARAQVRKVL